MGSTNNDQALCGDDDVSVCPSLVAEQIPMNSISAAYSRTEVLTRGTESHYVEKFSRVSWGLSITYLTTSLLLLVPAIILVPPM